MKVSIQMFAVARELAGSGSIEVELPAAATVAEVRRAVLDRLPRLAQFGPSLRFAVNADYAEDGDSVSPGDDIACIPPVSGG